ncbi:MAG: hypothetical protein Q9159_001042 [Coniocarpon cinnabarinum]
MGLTQELEHLGLLSKDIWVFELDASENVDEFFRELQQKKVDRKEHFYHFELPDPDFMEHEDAYRTCLVHAKEWLKDKGYKEHPDIEDWHVWRWHVWRWHVWKKA